MLYISHRLDVKRSLGLLVVFLCFYIYPSRFESHDQSDLFYIWKKSSFLLRPRTPRRLQGNGQSSIHKAIFASFVYPNHCYKSGCSSAFPCPGKRKKWNQWSALIIRNSKYENWKWIENMKILTNYNTI